MMGEERKEANRPRTLIRNITRHDHVIDTPATRYPGPVVISRAPFAVGVELMTTCKMIIDTQLGQYTTLILLKLIQT